MDTANYLGVIAEMSFNSVSPRHCHEITEKKKKAVEAHTEAESNISAILK